MHIALLGDSILDNAPYTDGLPDVTARLEERLGPDGRVTLLAVDGSMMDDIDGQVAHIDPTVTHVVLSVGGNDAIEVSDVLGRPVGRVGEAFAVFDHVIADFRRSYRAALEALLSAGRPAVVLTIYDGWFGPDEAPMLRTALRSFNDVIIGEATSRGLPVIDLRRVCTRASDYANPIEPSSSGGDRIAEQIEAVVRHYDFDRGSAVLPHRPDADGRDPEGS
ncbi:MAG TPA: SGNH/GDSL hydrolase family protein, partial [Longimicrobiales bacterium]|nr:SGNH/GDSL hydrolase family protein [Longimicrobiales bacterium]